MSVYNFYIASFVRSAKLYFPPVWYKERGFCLLVHGSKSVCTTVIDATGTTTIAALLSFSPNGAMLLSREHYTGNAHSSSFPVCIVCMYYWLFIAAAIFQSPYQNNTIHITSKTCLRIFPIPFIIQIMLGFLFCWMFTTTVFTWKLTRRDARAYTTNSHSIPYNMHHLNESSSLVV